MPYKHGAYGELGQTTGQLPPSGVATLPVYFGRAPVHQIRDYTGLVNQPILVSSFEDAVRKIGYSDNWADYELCEAIYAHFKSAIGPIGPIVLVNVLDPATMKGGEPTTVNVLIVNSQGVIKDEKVILDSITITGKVFGTDYTAFYSPDGSKVIIRDLTGGLGASVSVTYDRVTPESVTTTEVIGGITDETRTGIQAVGLVYQNLNQIPTILAAPGWSDKKAVRDALVAASQKINGHWYAFVFTDIPADAETNTRAKAITWKNANGYNAECESPCWPLAVNGDRVFHLSTLAVVTAQRTDYLQDNIPSETPSNKRVDITGLAVKGASGIVPVSYDQEQANQLNAEGIKTAIFWGGQWKLWGGHTGAYKYGADNDPRSIFDSSMRMLYHILNTFQKTYGPEVDATWNRQKIDTILNSFQEWLDMLRARGRVLGATIHFDPAVNPTNDMIEGNFRFDIPITTAPQGKSITAWVAYTTDGLSVLLEGGEAA
ncbi:MAG: phage tail sheath protein [Peptococcaceae bacterium]|jgi:phage tail sheath protein FI|nr:phage tail sheath protein [Peptococcaceae bacterium]MDH7525287.1 phage tail sheath protein [Peptococcaceae bacterium]